MKMRMSLNLRRLISYVSLAGGGVLLYAGYLAGKSYAPAPDLPRQLYRREYFDFVLTVKSPFLYLGLFVVAAGIFLLSSAKGKEPE